MVDLITVSVLPYYTVIGSLQHCGPFPNHFGISCNCTIQLQVTRSVFSANGEVRRRLKARWLCCVMTRVTVEVLWRVKINKTRGLLLASTVSASTTVLRASSHVSQPTSTGSTKPSTAIRNQISAKCSQIAVSLNDTLNISLLSTVNYEPHKTAVHKSCSISQFCTTATECSM